ncbi:hypothetical protein MUDAN_BIHEEGNE_01391 [Lactiplantibacillus mudanjiangensis]|nr:hypothetical protein MUDAN_BIHEEGNE_01391 [Lactiplantibacillus mudanjiangensis]
MPRLDYQPDRVFNFVSLIILFFNRNRTNDCALTSWLVFVQQMNKYINFSFPNQIRYNASQLRGMILCTSIKNKTTN